MASRLTALGIAVIGLVFWLFGGPNLGWTKNRVPISKQDPVTEQEYVEWQPIFVPGVDFVGGCVLLAALVYVGSLLGAPRRTDPSAPPGRRSPGPKEDDLLTPTKPEGNRS